MRGRGGGSLVNIASTSSSRPQPHQASYTASKHGAAQPDRPLRHDDEIARAALRLSSDDASFTTVHGLAVDGGYLAR